MYITYELLKEKGACSNGLNWFKQNFPEGCELNEETVAITTIEGRKSDIELHEALDIAIAALYPVSREQVEKVWKGCSWCNNEGKKPENWECSLLDDRGFSVVVGDEVVWTNAEFCPVCGKPLTDNVADTLIKRLEALKDEETD